MTWNWQQEDWPNFKYDKSVLEGLENNFLKNSGILIGAFKHLSEDNKKKLIIEIISNEALKTSEIEGEYLNRDSVQSSIRRQFGLQTDNHTITPAEQGITELMMNLYESFDKPLDDEQLFNWHRMITKGRNDLKDVGRYRTHSEPMQVISGAFHRPNIHFEAPPSKDMEKEMKHFIKWFNDTALGGKDKLPLLTRAAIAHLYFVSIHPFEDGNGRIARAISEKALAQSIGKPTLIALSHMIAKQKKIYYDELERANKHNEITAWISYFAQTVLEAQSHTQIQIEFMINKTKFYDRFKDKFNERQNKVIKRIFQEGSQGFQGGLSAENYLSITKTTRATATRDLHDLVEKGALTRRGERKHTRYYLNIREVGE
ncbi:FIC domain-containing protein Huntingtin-interacting protein E [endosymbiont of Acanthamoeba sp. UWC8]|uniref:Fic family protein n=1 Tax=endosymbiont of Acanthamoeba sp. UWC8 TaxID=86106 RepID=UPI0004D18E5B|nr:Fic family protein [endosymbiont of Acanthamoeba sp. UWC8]AIF81167.1 FIC domain-containing protein Huntingtin-interacting protein E [endosymbiont of Acanthamoeba sp. UWC8]